MMHIPIVKYDPKFRDKNGVYQKDEWTAYSDIGKVIGGKKLNVKEYYKTEELYIQAVLKVVSFFKPKGVRLSNLYKHSTKKIFVEKGDLKLYEIYKGIKEAQVIKEQELLIEIVRLALREYLRVKLVVNSRSNSRIIFGFDYYMYLVTNREITEVADEIRKSGLFVMI